MEHKGGQGRRKHWEQCQTADFQAKPGTEWKTSQSVQSRRRTGSQWEMFKKRKAAVESNRKVIPRILSGPRAHPRAN